MKIKIYNDDDTLRGCLVMPPECTIWDFADDLRLLCQMVGYTPRQASEIIQTLPET